MQKSILLKKRKKARELRKKGWSILKIARYLDVQWISVKKWLEMEEEDLEKDRRGRYKGELIKYNETMKKRIVNIREQLEHQEAEYRGAQTVKLEYQRRFDDDISEWFIYKTIKEHIREKSLRRERESGKPVDYPLKKMKTFGRVIMSIEIISMKQSKGKSLPVHFLFCKYISPHKAGIVSQIAAKTTNEVIRILKYVWLTYIKPDIVKLNFSPKFGAFLTSDGCIGTLTIFLLNLGIIPFYLPRRSSINWIGGDKFKSIFSDFFSQQLCFQGNRDLKIENFYLEYRTKSGKSGQLKIEEPLRKSIFTGVDFENREVNKFLADKIFFCILWKHG